MKIARIAAVLCFVILLLLAVAGCGGDAAVTEEEASDIAEQVITESYPDMAEANRTSQSYTSEGSEFFEYTYSQTIEVESDGETVELPQIVIITIDKDTGEQFVSVSD